MDANDLPIIELKGTPREKGRMHGEALRPQIHELLSHWREGFATGRGAMDYAVYKDAFWDLADTLPALKKYTPYLIEEVEGIAEAANVDFEEMLLFQHGNEEVWVTTHLGESCRQEVERCSTVAALGSGEAPTLVCQNLDWVKAFDGYQVMFRSNAANSDMDLLLMSCAGEISMNGLNSRGVAVGDNSLPQLRPQKGGLPVFAIYRAILECQTYTEAERFLNSIPHSSGLNWVFGDPDNIGMFEVSADKVVPYDPCADGRRLWHTNHPMVNDDYDAVAMGKMAAQACAMEEPFPRSSYLRWASLQMRFWDRREPITVDQVKAAFASCDDPENGVCTGAESNPEDQRPGYSLAACIWELDRESPKFHVAPGAALETAFRTFSFDE